MNECLVKFKYSVLYGEFKDEKKKGKKKMTCQGQNKTWTKDVLFKGKFAKKIMSYFSLIDERMECFIDTNITDVESL